MNEKKFNDILLAIKYEGKTLNALSKEMKFSKATFYMYLECETPYDRRRTEAERKKIAKERQNQYARAHEVKARLLYDEILAIAESPEIAEEVKYDAKGKVIERKVGDAIQHRKLKIDAIKWIIARDNPKKYGDRVQLEGVDEDEGGSPLRFVINVDKSKMDVKDLNDEPK